MSTFKVSIEVCAEIIIEAEDETDASDLAQGVTGLSLSNGTFKAMQDVQVTYVNIVRTEEQ